MPVGRKVWGGLLILGAAVEVYGILTPGDDDTLSEFTRWAFHTQTPQGAGLFVVAVLGFVTWFIPHILERKKK